MIKATVLGIIILTGVWVILCESLTAQTLITGVAAAAACLAFCRKYMPALHFENINLFRLIVYFFYLIGQVYLAGITAIGLILSGAGIEIVNVKTKLENGLLKTVLANSITLTPGTVSLELEGDIITVLRLGREPGGEKADTDEAIKGKLERMLLKAQK